MGTQKDPVETQLGSLAAAKRSGVLRVSGGDGSGAVHLRAGTVAYAESDAVPGAADRLARYCDDKSAMPGLTDRMWVIREATADAVTALLSGPPRYGRFRAGAAANLPGTEYPGMPVAQLLAEVARRRQIISQMSAVLTADTIVARNPRLRSPAVQVSAAQWALLIRMADPRTVRSLALELGASVFVSTIEVFRLVRLNLALVIDGPGFPASPPDGDDFPGTRRAAISHIRAVAQVSELT